MEYLPLFVDLKGKSCLVVGGGTVANRKTRALLRVQARVSVVAPKLNKDLSELSRTGVIQHIPTVFSEELVADKFLVFTATDDVNVNTRVYQAASRARCLVNSVDDPKRSNFISPAVVDRSPLLVAISSGGAAPVLARRLRAKLEQELPKRLGDLARLAEKFRETVKKVFSTLRQRRQFWEDTLEGPIAEAVLRGDVSKGEALLEQSLSHSTTDRPGVVGLVGAGPGDSGLMTLRGMQWLQTADVILYDRLVSQDVLELARRDADLVFVGKKPGCHQISQDQIIDTMIQYAQQGKKVCRLKGGDPFIFGRGGEELEALRAASIDYEVVPGITAATGASAYSGIPLTHREHATSVRFVTAHCKQSLECLDWKALAKDGQTLVFYMGVAKLETLQRQLVQHGRGGGTPIAFVENATRSEQRVVTATLSSLFATAQAHNIVSPSVLIIGEVAKLGQTLGWFGRNPTPNPQLLAATGT